MTHGAVLRQRTPAERAKLRGVFSYKGSRAGELGPCMDRVMLRMSCCIRLWLGSMQQARLQSWTLDEPFFTVWTNLCPLILHGLLRKTLILDDN